MSVRLHVLSCVFRPLLIIVLIVWGVLEGKQTIGSGHLDHIYYKTGGSRTHLEKKLMLSVEVLGEKEGEQ